MPKFKVRVAETIRVFYRAVEVDAPTGEEAVELAEKMAGTGLLPSSGMHIDYDDTEVAA